ncbi:glycosyltransferase [Candidatus Kapabacteria bacterium]|nr:glycosyltransferase [Candidatus Kapabacteria bacterium]
MSYFIVIIAILLFLIRSVFFIIGLRKNRKLVISKQDFSQNVSIIIPARNEESNIKSCLKSILDCEYPSSKVQIIVINDRSSDNTEAIVRSQQKLNLNIELVNITNESAKDNIPGKAGAIHQGLIHAKNELVLMTDADCTVTKTWISGLVNVFNTEKADMVASFSIINAVSVFDKLQELQWFYMNCMASGSAGMNYLLGCYGNNQSFKRSCYFETGGYKEISFSVTEDLALLQEFHKNNFKISYPCDPMLEVKTNPISSIGDYIKQQHRWAVGGKSLGFKAFLFVITSLSIWVGGIFCILENNYFLLSLLLISRIAFDASLMIPALRKFNLFSLQKYILIGVPFFLILELISPTFLLNSKVKWKGQVFR